MDLNNIGEMIRFEFDLTILFLQYVILRVILKLL